MTHAEALDALEQAKHLQASRFRVLCDEGNPDTEQRDAYRKLVINLATGQHRPEPKAYPPLLTQAGNAVKAVGQAIASGGERCTEEEQEARLAICRSCEFFDAGRQRCRKCGCKIPWKVHLKAWHCPIDLW